MSRFCLKLKQQTWLKVFPLLFMMAPVSAVFAAPTPKFSVNTTGTTNNVNLTANMELADADFGKTGNYYLGFFYQNQWNFNNGPGWVMWNGGVLPPYATELLANRNIVILRNVDISHLIGGQLYIGYGLSESDMLTNNKYAMVYTVTADTDAPTVSSTFHLNGATNVPTNAAVGATFSEIIALSTLTTSTFSVKESVSGNVVAGTVGYNGVTAVFYPTTPLLANTRYTVTVKSGSTGIKDMAGNAMVSDFVIGWTTGSGAETTPPTVSGTVNANRATNVAINTGVGATFSEAMDPLSINATNLVLTLKGATVPGTVTYSGVNVVFVPSAFLQGNAAYTVTVKGGAGGVKDLAGNVMTSDFVWGWTTSQSSTPVDNTAPKIAGSIHLNGAINIATNTVAGLTFSEAMDPWSVTNLSYTLKETVSGNAVAGVVHTSGVNVTFVPLVALTANTRYTVLVKGGLSGVKDLAGNAMASDFTLSWTTGSSADTTAPTVAGTIHANGATNVPINAALGATFSEAINPLTITNQTFTLKDTNTSALVTGVVSYSGVSAVFKPLEHLEINRSYTATIKGGSSGVRDVAGNLLVADYVWVWTTTSSDNTAPSVISTVNANGATNVALNTQVGATFSEGMDPLTLNTVSFTLKEKASGNAVAGVVSYAGSNAVFIPLTNLSPNLEYTATINGSLFGVKDLADNLMVSDYVWSWTTAAQ